MSKVIEIIIKVLMKQLVKKAAGKAAVKAVSQAQQLAKYSVKNTTGKLLINKFGDLIKSFGSNTDIKRFKNITKFIKSEDKYGDILKKIAHTNKLSGKLYDKYVRDRKQQWQQLAKQFHQVQSKYEQNMIKIFQKREGISRKEFGEFRDWYLQQLNKNQQKMFSNLFKEELEVVFESSWILFGVFIPYGRKSQSGILALQLKWGSERNPTGYYQWVRVPKKVWDKLTKTPTGREFWRIWYHKNRKNKRYLTIESIYYNKNKTKSNKK